MDQQEKHNSGKKALVVLLCALALALVVGLGCWLYSTPLRQAEAQLEQIRVVLAQMTELANQGTAGENQEKMTNLQAELQQKIDEFGEIVFNLTQGQQEKIEQYLKEKPIPGFGLIGS